MKISIGLARITSQVRMILLKLAGHNDSRPQKKLDATNEKQTVFYNDSRITLLGRWIDTGSGTFSGWSSSQMVFSVRGTSFVNVICETVETNANDYSSIAYSIDNSPDNLSFVILTDQHERTPGTKSITIEMPNLGTHTLTIQAMGVYVSQYADTSRVSLKAIELSTHGTLFAWTQGNVNLQTIGDSWMAGFNGMTRLLDREYFNVHSVATPGITSASMRSQYVFDFAGKENTSDPVMDGIVIAYGINECLAGMDKEQFRQNMLALIDEVRTKQPTAKIVFMRIPSNIAAGKFYGQYGAVLSDIPGLHANVYYFDTSSIDEKLVGKWHDDWHLSAEGKVLLMAALERFLKTNVGL